MLHQNTLVVHDTTLEANTVSGIDKMPKMVHPYFLVKLMVGILTSEDGWLQVVASDEDTWEWQTIYSTLSPILNLLSLLP